MKTLIVTTTTVRAPIKWLLSVIPGLSSQAQRSGCLSFELNWDDADAPRGQEPSMPPFAAVFGRQI